MPQETVRQTIAKALAGVTAAANAPRCMHVRVNGVRCGSPALRNDPFCYFHDRMNERMPAPALPALEDAESVQVALMEVLEQVYSGKMAPKQGNSMFYGLQVASANLRHARFRHYDSVTVLPINEARQQHRIKEAGAAGESCGTAASAVKPSAPHRKPPTSERPAELSSANSASRR
jgi:hypothetical protein